MRIAALIATESVSGPGRQLAALARELGARGIEFHVLLTSRGRNGRPPFAEYLQRAGVRHAILADRGPLDWRMVSTTRHYLQSRDIPLLQTHGYKATAIGAALRRLDPARRWIGFYHGATSKGVKDTAYQGLERLLIRGADRIVVVARHQAALFRGRDRDVLVIDNAVVPELPSSKRRKAPWTSAPIPRPALGVIGRLSHEKGIDVFLHACRLLADRDTMFTAFIIGDGPARAELEQLNRRLGLGERVRFTGHVDSPAAVYADLDLVVLPSRTEGLPNVLLEALAADRPVVATSVGAVPEVLADPGAGYLVPPEDPAALADAIAAALDAGPAAGQSARRSVLDRYSLSARVDRHVELYSDLLSAAAASSGGSAAPAASAAPARTTAPAR